MDWIGTRRWHLQHFHEIIPENFENATEEISILACCPGEVVIMDFGKGAGIALYASLLNIFPKQVCEESSCFRDSVRNSQGEPQKAVSMS